MQQKTLYVYDKGTGILSYTIDNPTSTQLSNLKSKGISGHVDRPGFSLINTYVTVNTITQETSGIAKIKDIEDYIVCSDNKIIANGTHTVTVSNLHIGSSITIHDNKNGDLNFVPNVFDTTMEFTANQISSNPNENKIKFTIHQYGHNPKSYYIPLVSDE